MKRFLLVFLSLVVLNSCKSKKTATHKRASKTVKTTHTSDNPRVERIVDYAKSFEGVRYKYGGTTKRGMDCSGLVYTSFQKENIALPRTTADLSGYGDWVDVKALKKGDLVFFATRKNSRKVNHVGIVTFARNGRVEFIHASTSKGVMISSLAERYWYFAYVQARRIL